MPNSGTTFTASSEPLDILMVDDREDNLLTLEATLRSPEYNLIKAQSGDEALRYLLEREPALILMDVQMPDIDGFETAKIIKQSERSRHIPIIFVTAINKEERFVHHGYQSGAVDYISKPFDPEILKSKVAVFVELHRKTKQLLAQERFIRQAELRETERKLAQLEIQALRREHAEKQRYIDLVDGIEQGVVWAADPVTFTTTFVSPSAERLLGFSAPAWKSEAGLFLKRVHEDDQDRFQLALREQNDTQQGVRIEHRFVRADGTIAWLQTWMRTCPRADGVGEELHGLSVDITNLKQTEEELRDAIASRDEFFSIASHELKTPVTPIKLQVQLIQRALYGKGMAALTEEKLKKSLGTCEKQIDRLSKLVDELLDVSRIRTGKLTLEIASFDLTELMSETVDRFQELAKTKGLSISLAPCEPAEVSLDRFRIEQVIVNLITNAIKYSSKGTVEISMECDPEWVSFSVKDQGIGIADEDQRRIFDRFERAVSSANYSGLGLGLYIVTEILRAQNGKISLESQQGDGSKFTVKLPRSFKPATPDVPTAAGLRTQEPTIHRESAV